MIGGLPDTLADRSIEIRLRRKLASEHVARFRPDRATDLLRLARMAARWSADHFEALLRADPLIPAGLHDRAADNWEPLFAIADEAGGEWPERARNIAIIFSAREDEGGSHGELLLADIRETFDLIERGIVKIRLDDAGRIVDLDRIRSADLARILAGKEDRPWPEFGPRRLPINMRSGATVEGFQNITEDAPVSQGGKGRRDRQRHGQGLRARPVRRGLRPVPSADSFPEIVTS